MNDLHTPDMPYNAVRGSSDLLEHIGLNLHITILNSWRVNETSSLLRFI